MLSVQTHKQKYLFSLSLHLSLSLYIYIYIYTYTSLCNPWRHVLWNQPMWLHLLSPQSFEGSFEECIFKLHICCTLLLAYGSALVAKKWSREYQPSKWFMTTESYMTCPASYLIAATTKCVCVCVCVCVWGGGGGGGGYTGYEYMIYISKRVWISSCNHS